jgi:hypothetical protein
LIRGHFFIDEMIYNVLCLVHYNIWADIMF